MSEDTVFESCRYCDGEGAIKVAEARTYSPDTASPEEWDECPQCGGFGYVESEANNSRVTKEDITWAEADLAWERMKAGW